MLYSCFQKNILMHFGELPAEVADSCVCEEFVLLLTGGTDTNTEGRWDASGNGVT